MGEFGGRKVKEEMYNYILVSEIKEKSRLIPFSPWVLPYLVIAHAHDIKLLLQQCTMLIKIWTANY